MLRIIIILSFLLFNSSGLADTINEKPMYGNVQKTPQQIEADQRFITDVTQRAGSREAAAHQVVKLGWDYFYKGDPTTAMKRFNQAWLLNPNMAEVFWGFGVVTGTQGNFQDSIKYLDQAHGLDSKNARIISDLGFAYTQVREYKKADGYFKSAIDIDPNLEVTYSQWAAEKFLSGEYSDAWKMVKKSRSLGAKTLDPRLVADLTKKMPEPK